MNIDTSSSAISSTSSSTATISQSSQTSKSDSASFKDEMKTASAKEEQAAEKTEQAEEAEQTKETEQSEETQKTEDDNKDSDNKDKSKDEAHLDSDKTLKAELKYNDLKIQNESLLSKNIQSLINTRDMISFNNTDFSSMQASLNYQSISMDDNDAMFFTDLVKNTDMSMQSIAGQLSQISDVNVQAAEKTAKVSATMMNLLSDSLKTNQPFRIDFDKDVSVIIKVNKDGSIMANFIPGDKAVEEYLKNNIGYLRQRFDEQNLSYSQLSYSKHKQQQEQQNQNKKENADE